MPQDLPELNSILHSGALSYGQWAHEFEKRVAEYVGAQYVLTTSSFADAFQVLLCTLQLEPGDEVVASPMACLQSNMPFAYAGLKVVWADIDPNTGTLDPESVENAISPKTKLISHNHFCGYPGYIDEINSIGAKYGITVVDDCIEAFGSKYKGKRMGNVGTDVSLFSFQTVRLPNTIDGGAIAFKNRELYEKAIIARDLGIDRKIFRDADGEISPLCDIAVTGYAATPGNVNGYIGCTQLEKLDELLEKQAANAKRWDDMLKGDENIKPFNLRANTDPNYWVYGVLADNKHTAMRDFRNRGFYASGVHLPNTYYSVFGEKRDLKGVMEFYSKFLALPCGWWM